MEFGPDFQSMFIAILISFAILMGLTVIIIKILIYCKIFSKAGYCWALGLLMFIPIANIIMPFVLAFGDWPLQKELRLMKKQQEKPPA